MRMHATVHWESSPSMMSLQEGRRAAEGVGYPTTGDHVRDAQNETYPSSYTSMGTTATRLGGPPFEEARKCVHDMTLGWGVLLNGATAEAVEAVAVRMYRPRTPATIRLVPIKPDRSLVAVRPVVQTGSCLHYGSRAKDLSNPAIMNNSTTLTGRAAAMAAVCKAWRPSASRSTAATNPTPSPQTMRKRCGG